MSASTTVLPVTHARGRHAFGPKIGGGGLRRREVEIGQPPNQPPVHFFRERRALAGRAQPCLEMGEIDARKAFAASAAASALVVSP